MLCFSQDYYMCTNPGTPLDVVEISENYIHIEWQARMQRMRESLGIAANRGRAEVERWHTGSTL